MLSYPSHHFESRHFEKNVIITRQPVTIYIYSLYIFIYIYIYIYIFVYFAHCSCSLSTLLDWVESLYVRRSLFAICIAHCSQFEHSGDSTMQSSQCVTVHPVPKFRNCHKAIMVITGRAHCYTFCIFRSLLVQFEHSFGLGGESLC